MNLKTFWHSKNKNTDNLTQSEEKSVHFNYKTAIETRFADFDILGHVNNAVYFTYIEIARTRYWKEVIHWDWEKTGIVLAHASLDFITPILMDDTIHIYVKTSRIGKSSFDLDYQIVKDLDGKEVLCCKGKTVCIAIDYENGRPTPVPEAEKEKIISFERL